MFVRTPPPTSHDPPAHRHHNSCCCCLFLFVFITKQQREQNFYSKLGNRISMNLFVHCFCSYNCRWAQRGSTAFLCLDKLPLLSVTVSFYFSIFSNFIRSTELSVFCKCNWMESSCSGNGRSDTHTTSCYAVNFWWTIYYYRWGNDCNPKNSTQMIPTSSRHRRSSYGIPLHKLVFFGSHF